MSLIERSHDLLAKKLDTLCPGAEVNVSADGYSLLQMSYSPLILVLTVRIPGTTTITALELLCLTRDPPNEILTHSFKSMVVALSFRFWN